MARSVRRRRSAAGIKTKTNKGKPTDNKDDKPLIGGKALKRKHEYDEMASTRTASRCAIMSRGMACSMGASRCGSPLQIGVNAGPGWSGKVGPALPLRSKTGTAYRPCPLNPNGSRGLVCTRAAPEIVNVTGTDTSYQNLIVFGSVAAAIVVSLAAAFKGEPGLCEGCEGTGGAKCFGCEGTGRLETARDTGEGKRDVVGRTVDRYKCNVCGGSGLLACKRCNGSGLSNTM
eukprot:jgi/Tetstr1/448313/TSEL_035597.t1